MAKSMIRAVVALLAIPFLVGCGAMPQFGQSSNNNTTAKPSPAQATGVTPAVAKPSQALAANVDSTVVDASKLASFQPYTPISAVKRGGGDGYAKGEFYRNRSLKEIVNLLKTPKAWAKEMNVSCETFVAQVREAHNVLDEGLKTCEGMATFLEREKITVENCTPDMFTTKHKLALKAGEGFSTWHRACKTDKKGKVEQVVVWKGVPLFSTFCMNVSIPMAAVSAPAPQVPTKPASSVCPAKTIAISVWEAKASTFACAGPARVKELGDTSPFGSGHVSRECGPDFRKAFLKDDLKMVSSPTKLTMSHLRGGKVVRTLYDAVPPASEVRVGLPTDFRPGDSIRIVPESHTGLWSPLIKPMQSADWEFDHCVTLHSFVVK